MDNISVLMNFILHQYFSKARCLIVLTENPANFTYYGSQQIINFSINYYNNTIVIDRYVTDESHGCQNIIIDSVNPVNVFEQIENQIQHSVSRFNHRTYLFSLRRREMNINRLFKTEALTYVADLLIINPKRDDVFELWSHSYVGLKNNNFLRLVDVWFSRNSSFLAENNLFPDKLTSQNGRLIRFACFKYLPYTSCDRDLLNNTLHGTEMKLAMEFVKYHNLTVSLVFNDAKEEYWGTLYPNWTGSGIMGKVLVDEADIAFTAFFTWEFVYKYLDLSKPYIRSGITCLVPKPRIIGGWLTPILPYKNSLWIAVLINSVHIMIMLFLISKFYRRWHNRSESDASCSFLKSIWIVTKISLGQTLEHNEGRRNNLVIQYLLIDLFITYSVLNFAYFSGLSSTMTVPRYEAPINTVEDLANGNINILGIYEDWVLSIKEIDDVNYKKITKKFRIFNESQLRDLSKGDKNAFFLERILFHNYVINDFMKIDVIEDYHLMKEDVYWEYTVFFLRKSSILTPSFDLFLLRVIETGLAFFWQKKAVYDFMDFNFQRTVAEMDSIKHTQRNIIKLKFSHVKGTFALLLIGSFLASVAFILEIFIHYLQHKRGSRI